MTIVRAPEIEALFEAAGTPPLVVFRASVGSTNPVLLPEESAAAASMSPARLAAFTSGRAATAAALEHLGLPRHPITIGPGGEPRWPDGVIGSISHTDRVAYAVVGLAEPSTSGQVGVGIDVEDRRRITDDIISMILTDTERSTWAGLEPDERDAFATATFSAKEALYKAQFALTGAWLGFEHVALTASWPLPAGRAATAFRYQADIIESDIIEADHSPLDRTIERPLRVRSSVSPDEVISAVVLSRPASRERSR